MSPQPINCRLSIGLMRPTGVKCQKCPCLSVGKGESLLLSRSMRRLTDSGKAKILQCDQSRARHYWKSDWTQSMGQKGMNREQGKWIRYKNVWCKNNVQVINHKGVWRWTDGADGVSRHTITYPGLGWLGLVWHVKPNCTITNKQLTCLTGGIRVYSMVREMREGKEDTETHHPCTQQCKI